MYQNVRNSNKTFEKMYFQGSHNILSNKIKLGLNSYSTTIKTNSTQHYEIWEFKVKVNIIISLVFLHFNTTKYKSLFLTFFRK